ncbi:MAG: phosphopantetheine-binding protein [Methylotetracoccus sp.]
MRDAVVGGERGGQPILIAYVAGPDEAERAAVSRQLRARLPSYMIPAAFVWLSELPRTLSGKLDRRALPAVAERSAEAVRGSERRSQREQVLSGIWADVLGVAEVGREDNFLALGGHSLLAMRVVSRVRQAFGIELPLREVFEAEHLAALAARLDGAAPGEAVPELVAVEMRRGAAVVVCAGAAVVPRSTGAGQRVLQHPGGLPSRWSTGSNGAGAECREPGAAP